MSVEPQPRQREGGFPEAIKKQWESFLPACFDLFQDTDWNAKEMKALIPIAAAVVVLFTQPACFESGYGSSICQPGYQEASLPVTVEGGVKLGLRENGNFLEENEDGSLEYPYGLLATWPDEERKIMYGDMVFPERNAYYPIEIGICNKGEISYNDCETGPGGNPDVADKVWKILWDADRPDVICYQEIVYADPPDENPQSEHTEPTVEPTTEVTEEEYREWGVTQTAVYERFKATREAQGE